MSPGANERLARAGFDAWNRDDLAGLLALTHPEMEFRTSGVFPDFDDVYRGHDGFARFWRSMQEPWEQLRLDFERIEDRGDCYAVEFRFRAKGAGSGAAVDLLFSNAVRVRDGKATEVVARRSFEEALAVLDAWGHATT